MTPHPPNGPTYAADHWLSEQPRAARSFPQTVGGMFGTHFTDESYHRATSLDPSTLNVRATPLHLQVSSEYNRLAMGSNPAIGDGRLDQFGVPCQPGLGDMAQLEQTNAGEPKTNLADEYTNWEQHNA
jgi:hypothetical protein